MAKLPGDAPSAQVSLARGFVHGLVVGVVLAFGTLLVYSFGAGYFGALAVPPALNLAVTPVVLLGVVLVLWRFVA